MSKKQNLDGKLQKNRIKGRSNPVAKDLFTNMIFSDEKEAELFGKKSMKRGYEYKIVEYNKKNYDRYWYK